MCTPREKVPAIVYQNKEEATQSMYQMSGATRSTGPLPTSKEEES